MQNQHEAAITLSLQMHPSSSLQLYLAFVRVTGMHKNPSINASTQTHHPPMFAQNRHALLQHAPAARSYRASHGCGFWCLAIALARMPFRPDFPAVAASRPVAVTGRAQTECKADGTTGGLRSAEEMASEEFGPTWLTEAFHAAWALAWPEPSCGVKVANARKKHTHRCAVMWSIRGHQSLLESFHDFTSEAGTLPADNRVTKVLRTWMGFPMGAQLETARPCLLRAEDLAVKGFDAAGGAAMKMFLTAAGLHFGREIRQSVTVLWHVYEVEYEKPDPDLHTELFCKYP